jgi:hypothetical protein
MHNNESPYSLSGDPDVALHVLIDAFGDVKDSALERSMSPKGEPAGVA